MSQTWGYLAATLALAAVAFAMAYAFGKLIDWIGDSLRR